MNEWTLLTNSKPKHYQPVLCLLKNSMQVTAALDENNTDWVMYDHEILKESVIAWKDLWIVNVEDLV